MSTITVAIKNGTVAMAADSLTTFEDTKLPSVYDAMPEKIILLEAGAGRPYETLVGVVGYVAHFLVMRSVLQRADRLDFTSRQGLFETFRRLHPLLKEEYFLQTEAGEHDPYESSQVTVLVASPHGIFGVYDLREVHQFSRFWAMGSGTSFALGAMFATYEQAPSARAIAEVGVRAGAEFDRGSALPLTGFEIPYLGPVDANGTRSAGPRRRA